jgi:hypothetical protein
LRAVLTRQTADPIASTTKTITTSTNQPGMPSPDPASSGQVGFQLPLVSVHVGGTPS